MKIKITFITAIILSSLSACSNHVAPNGDDIQHAFAERGANISDVNVGKCKRHNGVDEGNDPHFDWYECVYTAKVDGVVKNLYGIFTSNSDGWHVDQVY